MGNEIAVLFRRLTHGVYIVGTADGARCGAFTAAWIMQASFDPPVLALSVNPGNTSYSVLIAGGSFTVNVLKQGQLELARRFGKFSGRAVDRLSSVRWRPGRGGAPILHEALAFFDCDVIAELPAGDHRLILGRVVAGAIQDAAATPMQYADTGDMDGSSRLYPHRL